MRDPLAYFISWTTKGSWLHGDDRGWVLKGIPVIHEPEPQRYEEAMRRMTHDEVVLTPEHRAVVQATIEQHCEVRGWPLHAVNPRTNHVHVVMTANDHPPEIVMEQFKAWCSRRLNENCGCKRKWWTEHGSTRWLNTEASVLGAVDYVLNRQ